MTIMDRGKVPPLFALSCRRMIDIAAIRSRLTRRGRLRRVAVGSLGLALHQRS